MYKVPESDYLIITQILCWTDELASGERSEHSWFSYSRDYMIKKRNFRPTSDIKDAFEVFRVIQERGHAVILELNQSGHFEVYSHVADFLHVEDQNLFSAIEKFLLKYIEEVLEWTEK